MRVYQGPVQADRSLQKGFAILQIRIMNYARLIRKDQDRRNKLTALQAAIDEDIASGDGEYFDFVAFKKKIKAKTR